MALSPGSALFLAVAVGGLALAALVLFAAPSRPQNRALSLFLGILGANYGADALFPLAADATLSYNLAFFTLATWQGAVLAYLAFLGLALDTPLVRPLRRPAARWALLALGVALTLFVRELFQRAPSTRLAGGAWDLGFIERYEVVSGFGIALALLFGLVASLHALRRAAPGSVARSRARAYAIAFGIQDGGLAIASVLDAAQVLDGATYFVVYALPAMVFLPLLSIALLRYQILDFELRMKWTVRRGTVVGAFVGAFVVVSSIVEQWLEQYGALVGGLAVGVLLLALRPIERAADRIADAAMPRVRDTPEYRVVRRRELYRAAIESAMQDGEVTEKERSVLATLADELGLGAKETLEIEREARGAAAPS